MISLCVIWTRSLETRRRVFPFLGKLSTPLLSVSDHTLLAPTAALLLPSPVPFLWAWRPAGSPKFHFAVQQQPVRWTPTQQAVVIPRSDHQQCTQLNQTLWKLGICYLRSSSDNRYANQLARVMEISGGFFGISSMLLVKHC